MARASRRYSTPEASFDARVVKDVSGCWLWTGFVDAKGYGVIGIGGRRISKVHRYSYERFVGPIQSGMQLDHLCRVRHCANPAHLEPVTNQVNVLRGVAARPAATHCRRGHAFDQKNTYFDPRGARQCKACRAAATARYHHRRTVS